MKLNYYKSGIKYFQNNYDKNLQTNAYKLWLNYNVYECTIFI